MSTREQQAKALEIITPLATKAERLYGVPCEMTVAQAMIESAWMRKVVGNHNCYGMKKMPRHKASAWVKTREVLTDAQLKTLRRKVVAKTLGTDGKWDVVIEDEFADFPSFEDAVKDYAWLISSGSPYAKAWEKFKRNSVDWESLACDISGIYATGRGYADLLIAVAKMPTVRVAIEKARGGSPTPVKVTEGPKTDALIDQYRAQGLDVVIVATGDESKFTEMRAQ